MDITQQSPVILSLCPGIRGLERGLERIFRSLRVAAYVEIEAFIVENLLSAMETGLVDAAPIWSNLKTFNPYPFRNRIDGIIGGYPCQPFSFAGNRGGDSDPRHLYPYIESGISAIRPFWCFFENVAGHLTMGYTEVSESLRKMGYRVESGIYTAEEVGSTHERERLFILAILADTDSNGMRGRFGEVLCQAEANEAQTCRQNREWYWNEYRDCCSEMGHTNSQRLQVPFCREQQGVHKTNGSFKRGEFSGADPTKFPLGQGFYQWDWEEPRTIESSLDFTINGYNFSEDLHRAIGNSVVEQTAEIAFSDLLRKHLER